jgi:hypothetical protein
MSYSIDVKEAAQAGTLFGFGMWGLALIAIPLVVGIGYLSYLAYAFYAPRYEQVRYDTFKQSQAYNDGMIRDLQDLKRDYISANDEQKAALKALTIHRFSVYEINRLPPDLQAFYYSLEK